MVGQRGEGLGEKSKGVRGKRGGGGKGAAVDIFAGVRLLWVSVVVRAERKLVFSRSLLSSLSGWEGRCAEEGLPS